jgi:hypothetical protein
MAQPHNIKDKISVLLTAVKAWKFIQDLLGGCPELIIINYALIKERK